MSACWSQKNFSGSGILKLTSQWTEISQTYFEQSLSFVEYFQRTVTFEYFHIRTEWRTEWQLRTQANEFSNTDKLRKSVQCVAVWHKTITVCIIVHKLIIY